jgi:hypothetical protein
MSISLTRRVVGFALCLAVVGCSFEGPGVTRANFERIKTDGSMTREDVDKLFGVKGHDYQGDAGQQIAVGFEAIGNKLQGIGKGPGGAPAPGSRTTYVRWGDDNRNVVVTIRNGKVVDKQQRGIH